MSLKMYSLIQAGCITLAIIFFVIGGIVFGISGEATAITSKSASSVSSSSKSSSQESASSSVSGSSKSSPQEIADAAKDIANTYIESTKEAMEMLKGNY